MSSTTNRSCPQSRQSRNLIGLSQICCCLGCWHLGRSSLFLRLSASSRRDAVSGCFFRHRACRSRFVSAMGVDNGIEHRLAALFLGGMPLRATRIPQVERKWQGRVGMAPPQDIASENAPVGPADRRSQAGLVVPITVRRPPAGNGSRGARDERRNVDIAHASASASP